MSEFESLYATLQRQDYFGQTVNIASRVQRLSNPSAIYVTGSIVGDAKAAGLLAAMNLVPAPQSAHLKGVDRDIEVFAIP